VIDTLKILFFGSVIKPEDCTKYLGPSVAGNKMQLGIIKGLKKIHPNISVVTEIPIAAYPRERRVIIKANNIEIEEDIKASAVPFINIFFLKQISMIICAFFVLLKWSIRNKKEKKIIITFNPFPYISVPTILVSKFFNIKKVCIFADPPIEVVKRKLLGKMAKYIEIKSTEKNVKKYDGIVVLNKKAAEKYAPDIKYVLVDGGFDIDDKPKNKPGGQWLKYSEGDIIDIVFSGGLYEYNGLINLVDAFKSIKNDYLRLNIYGEGPLKEYIKKVSQEDCRIVYHGNVSNDKMLIIQQNAGILINPRPIDDAISLYTFPSKMIEYMLSGTPVVTTKLNGLTSDYLDKVFVIENNSTEELRQGIEHVLSLEREQLIHKAREAREFIINNKTWELQSKKIYEFVNEIIKIGDL